MMATIPRDDVHSLSKILKRGFCPQSSMEISERGRSFFDLRQGNESVTSFTTSVLQEKNIFKFLGEVKSDGGVETVVIGGLATDDAKAFAFRLVHRSLPEFISEVNSYVMLISYQRRSQGSATPCVRSSNQTSSSMDSALLTDSSQFPQCWHRGNNNHYRPSNNTSSNPDGHTALVIIDDGTNAPTTNTMDDFDWLSLGSFNRWTTRWIWVRVLRRSPWITITLMISCRRSILFCR